MPKVREVDRALRADALLRDRVREVHPELSFRVLHGAPLALAADGHPRLTSTARWR